GVRADTNIKPAKQSARRAVVKHARIPAVSPERAKSVPYESVVHMKSVFHRASLRYKPGQVVAIESERQCSEVAPAEYRGIQLIESLVIETFGDTPSQVLLESVSG